MEVTEEHIERCVAAIEYEEPIHDTRNKLLAEGMSDYDIFLAYQGARLILKARYSPPPPIHHEESL